MATWAEENGCEFGKHLLEPMSEWRHVKTGSTYIVIGLAQCSTNGKSEGEESVVYWSKTYKGLRYREVKEFLDGRFVPLKPDGTLRFGQK